MKNGSRCKDTWRRTDHDWALLPFQTWLWDLGELKYLPLLMTSGLEACLARALLMSVSSPCANSPLVGDEFGVAVDNCGSLRGGKPPINRSENRQGQGWWIGGGVQMRRTKKSKRERSKTGRVVRSPNRKKERKGSREKGFKPYLNWRD